MSRKLLLSLVIFFVFSNYSHARRRILSVREALQDVDLIVYGKIVSIDNHKTRAYGKIAIQYVLQGNKKLRSVTLTWIRNSRIKPSPMTFKLNQRGMWLLKKFPNTKHYYCSWDSFFSTNNFTKIRKVLAILKIPSYKVPALFKSEKKKKRKAMLRRMKRASLVVLGEIITVDQSKDPRNDYGVIKIDAVYKGNKNVKTVKVRFPSPRIKDWDEHVKTQKIRDQGIWILHKALAGPFYLIERNSGFTPLDDTKSMDETISALRKLK